MSAHWTSSWDGDQTIPSPKRFLASTTISTFAVMLGSPRLEALGLIVGRMNAGKTLLEHGTHVGMGEDIEIAVENPLQRPGDDLGGGNAMGDEVADLRRLGGRGAR